MKQVNTIISKLGLFLSLSLFLFNTSFAQVPQKMNYQGIARDEKGNPLSKQHLSLKISILPTADATSPEYEEIQAVETNDFGLYTLQIGGGENIIGSMKTVKWETGNKYIHVSIDPTGGTNYVDMGTTQLLSVPYAMYADRAGEAKESAGTKTRATNNYIEKTNGSGVTNSTSLLYDNGVSIGLGTAAPVAGAKLHINQTLGNFELMRLQNEDGNAYGRFTMYNNTVGNYATFTKYGSTYPNGYAGIATLFPYANLLAFGNNGGGFLISNGGNVGISMLKGGTSKLKFFADFNTEYVGIGGVATPSAQVHFNSAATGDTLKITNATTGHLATDGFDIRTTGNNVSLMNKESGSLFLGTTNLDRAVIDVNGNMGIGTSTPTSRLEVAGQIKITGGSPGAGKVLTSDAGGLATWVTPAGGSVSVNTGTANFLPKYLSPTTLGQGTIYDDGTNVGIGTNTPHASLQLSNQVSSKKFVLYEDAAGGNEFYGLGVTAGLMRYQTTTSASHAFYASTSPTANVELMRIQSNGNVGIGTSAPSTKLEVSGQIKITGGTPGAGKVLTSDANGLATWTTPASGSGILGSGSSGRIPRFLFANTLGDGTLYDNGTNIGINNPNPHAPLQFANTAVNRKMVLYEVADNDHQFFGLGINSGTMRYQVGAISNSHVFYAGSTINASTELMRIVGSGNVGIGTSTPNAPLQFASNISPRKIVLYELQNNDNQFYGFGISTGMIRYQVGATAGDHVFFSGSSQTTSDELFRIKGDGNIGIGTSLPHAPLQFANVSNNRKIVLYENADNDHQVLGFGIASNTLRYQVASTTQSHIFYAGTSATTSNELMRIVGNGNVGIGTNAPTAKLSVNGSANNTSGAWGVFSDARVKTVTNDFTDGLNVINKIHAVKFKYNADAPFKADGEQIGVVAQELEKIAPYMVSQQEFGQLKDLREVNNQAYVFLLINAVKELSATSEAQQKIIEKQEALNANLLKRLEALEQK